MQEAKVLVFVMLISARLIDKIFLHLVCSPAKLFARKSGTYSEVADVLVTSDCLSQDIDVKLVSAAENDERTH